MKVALVHDYIKEYGGAERVLEALHEIFPDAPVYTTVFLPKFLGPHKERFKNWKIHTSFFQFLPFRSKLISPLRLLTPRVFKNFDFSGFDLIIVSATGAYFPNKINKRSALQACYCHTPPRYLYGYHTARNWKKNIILKILGETANHFLRIVDFQASRNVDYYIANSEEVKARIQKFYRKDAVVIYPPVDLESRIRNKEVEKEKNPNPSFKIHNSYYLAGGRLARAKGMDIIIDAFIKLNKPLKIFGRGFAGYEKELESRIKNQELREKNPNSSFKNRFAKQNLLKQTNSNIEFLGEISDEEKLELMKNAKAFVFASFDEDFGITPVEAMGEGTPVIAFKSGGVKETIIDGKTGVFYDKNTPSSLSDAIKRFEGLRFSEKDCTSQAQKFSKERFKKKINSFINDKINKV